MWPWRLDDKDYETDGIERKKPRVQVFPADWIPHARKATDR